MSNISAVKPIPDLDDLSDAQGGAIADLFRDIASRIRKLRVDGEEGREVSHLFDRAGQRHRVFAHKILDILNVLPSERFKKWMIQKFLSARENREQFANVLMDTAGDLDNCQTRQRVLHELVTG